MADYRNIDATVCQVAQTSQANRPAGEATLTIVEDAPQNLDSEVVTRLLQATQSTDPSDCTCVMRDALASGVLREDMADFYIPELARQLGAQWCSDQIGFVGVTIGVSRLQAMLRELGPVWSHDHTAIADAPAIMLIVPENAHHTLGAMVLAGQLRRKGYAVTIMLGLSTADVAIKMKMVRFQAVFLSASPSEKLETLRRIVDVVKASSRQPPPVVIGGSIFETIAEKSLKALTGADHATKRPDEALRRCGLTTKPKDSINLMHEI
ncbi:cobalamin B12-binding domain-containing protein [Yoonia sp.]|uniref:cobalamin B12-binding domain-containing protein n=1 Tax=Yoonia sp. TaxID=2212373 RepID=UPI001A0E4778|nr:cobalamin B12-binding domain-containing protein [Yoonia sp.]MBE0412814.1 cobalamin B12-binding domain-containing protein [Yoonia sp.]